MTSDLNTLDGAETVFHLACLGVRHSLQSPEDHHLVSNDGSLTARIPDQDFTAGIRNLMAWLRERGKSPDELLAHVAAANGSGASVPV